MPAERTTRNRYYNGPVSDHFDGALFFNPDGAAPRGAADLLRWKLLDRGARWPASVPSPFAAAKPRARVDGDGLTVTMIGHSSLLLQLAGLNILTDPIWAQRALRFPSPGRGVSIRRESHSPTCRQSTSCLSATITTTTSIWPR